MVSMSNTDYYRFRNTVVGLSACKKALKDLVQSRDKLTSLQYEELSAAKKLILLCGEILDVFADDVDLGADLDAACDEINEVLDEINTTSRNEGN